MKTDIFSIKYTERDESWLHGGEVAVPLEITYRDGVADIEYYPAALGLVTEFAKLYGESEQTMFSRAATEWLAQHFEDFLASHGFSMSPDSEDYYTVYTLTPSDVVGADNIVRLQSPCEYNDLTDTDIDGLLDEGYIVYAAVIDESIAALANTGVPIDADSPEEIEIGVDTAEAYRRRGLGAACVRALTNELCRMGHTVTYECASGNAASVGLAESVGGKVTAKKIYIVGFSDPLEE